MSFGQMALGEAPRRTSWARRARNLGPITIAATIACVLLVMTAIFAPLLAPYDPSKIDPANVLAAPSPEHWLGTDESGRDILSRLIWGSRMSLLGPAVLIAVATTFGVILALVAAWFGGMTRSIISRVIEIMFAFPGIVVAILAAALFGANGVSAIVALSIAYIPVIARVLLVAAVKERNLPYIVALRVQGRSGFAICVRHLLPNLAPLILVQATVGFGYALLDLAGLSYLGLGVQPPTPDWGVMISAGQSGLINGAPEQAISAVVMVVITVVSFNFIGQRLADRYEIGV